jgi:hypothetical protein
MSCWTLTPDVTLLQSNFKFIGLFSLKLNGLVIKIAPAGRPLLVLVNPPRLTAEVRAGLQRLEAESEAKIEVILNLGDWHHFTLPDALALFPAAAVYVASERNVRKQPSIASRAKILDRVSPSIPEIGTELQIVPWLGYSQDGMPKMMSGEARGSPRIEFVLSHPASGTIFVTDHFQPAAAGKPLDVNTMGFKLDAAAARESVRRVLALNPRRLVTSHGGRDACVREAAEIAPAYDVLLEAHGVPPD